MYIAGIHPVITVAGPRYAGKTTLVKKLFQRHGYVDLEMPDILEFARTSPFEFLKYHMRSGGLVIDEYLRAPELMSHIRAAVKSVRQPGRFVLVTSRLPQAQYSIARPPLRYPATQILLPLTIEELRRVKFDLSRDEYIYRGFMPRVYCGKEIGPGHIYRNYLTDFIDRDAIYGPGNRIAFAHFMIGIARRIGQIINLATIAKEAGVSISVAVAWLSTLEAGFIIFRLPPYPKLIGKRTTKIPKFYFTDVGMAAFLLKIKSSDQVFRDPLSGNLFENMVVADAQKHCCNIGGMTRLSYYRDQNRLEVDLILDKRSSIVPIEIKSNTVFSPSFADSIVEFQKLSRKAANGNIVYGGKTQKRFGEPQYTNFKDMGKIVRGW
jgi:predicted AAA+ superfamily ATPase